MASDFNDNKRRTVNGLRSVDRSKRGIIGKPKSLRASSFIRIPSGSGRLGSDPSNPRGPKHTASAHWQRRPEARYYNTAIIVIALSIIIFLMIWDQWQ